MAQLGPPSDLVAKRTENESSLIGRDKSCRLYATITSERASWLLAQVERNCPTKSDSASLLMLQQLLLLLLLLALMLAFRLR